MGLAVTLPPPALLVPLAGALGLVFGSFLSALTWRLPRGDSVARGRSACPTCGHALTARDLVPVLSWLLARGRCRHCAAPVPARYPLIELTAAALLAVIAWRAGALDWPPAALAAAALLALVLLALAVVDLEHGLLPDVLTLAAAAPALALRLILDGPQGLLLGGLGALVGGGGAWLLRVAFRRFTGRDGLGLGDVKFLALAGLLLPPTGWPVYLFLAGCLGVGLGLVWRATGRGATFPFGPALILALLAVVLWPDLTSALLGGQVR